MPWLAIPHADRCLVEGGKVCTFSPCIEQIDKTAAELRRDGRYEGVRMFETLAVNWGVKEAAPSRKRKALEAAGSEGGDRPAAKAAESPSWQSCQLPMKS